MSNSFRRLAKDHTTLRKALPPNYLFEDSDVGVSLPDDLTQLTIWITGADGTPYKEGLWRLHLKMPIDYPRNPPKATFKTRIFHPNVEEETGAVCLETLKRDWDPKLTLKDILITISCLLIHPNPDSALNAKAGALIQEDYESFARQAKLMTSIHAPIPKHMKRLVAEARHRGEDVEAQLARSNCDKDPVLTSSKVIELEDELKENTSRACPDPQKSDLANLKASLARKRSLCEMSAPGQVEISTTEHIQGVFPMTNTESIIITNERPRKSPKHVHHQPDSNSEPGTEEANKENSSPEPESSKRDVSVTKHTTMYAGITSIPNRAVLRKMSNSSSGKLRNQARVGIRRL